MERDYEKLFPSKTGMLAKNSSYGIRITSNPEAVLICGRRTCRTDKRKIVL